MLMNIFYVNKLMKTQWLKREELENIQLKKLKRIVEHCYKNNEFYRVKFRKVGFIPSDLKTLDDMKYLPIVTKDELRENYNKVISRKYNNKNCYISHTSGSTGEIFTTLQNPEMYHYTRTFTLRMFLNFGISLFDRFGLVTHGFRPFDKKGLLQYLGLLKTSYFPGNMALEEIWKGISEAQPDLLQSYAGILLEITKMLKSGLLQQTKKIKPKLIVVVGEPTSREERNFIENCFNSLTLDAYPCMELNLLAFECEKKNGLHINSEGVIIEIIKDGKKVKNGEKGEVVITSLENKALPFIRYNIKDISSLKTDICECGRGLHLIDYIEGRSDDVLTLPSGIRIQPGQINAAIMHLCQNGIKPYELLDFFIIQNSVNSITVKLRLQNYNSEIPLKISESLKNLFIEPVKIDMEIVDKIERKVSHKRRKIMSHIKINERRKKYEFKENIIT